jgi:two-component system sensor histidine kinase UhpB
VIQPSEFVPQEFGGRTGFSRESVDAVEARVKLHLARELHDNVAQSLTTMLVQLENFKRAQAGRASVIREVDVLQDSTREVLDNIRDLLFDLRGESGVDQNFVEAIRGGLLRRFAESTGMSVQLRVSRSWPRCMASQTALNLYRILQEALNNVRLHSAATKVSVSLDRVKNGPCAMTVNDNGRGLELIDGVVRAGMGLLGIRERAILLGGEAEVCSQGDAGMSVRVTFPGGGLNQ